jgi:uncharacterized membrane protein
MNTIDIQKERHLVFVIYILYALSAFVGFTAIAAIIMNYIKKADVQGTFLESHYRWQMRTFWFGLLWGIIGVATSIFLIGFLILAVNSIWLLYRVIKGFLRLSDNREVD